MTVSYTHLDVYKRQTEYMSFEKALKDQEDGVKPTPTEPDSTVATTEAVETTASEEATTAPAPVSKRCV